MRLSILTYFLLFHTYSVFSQTSYPISQGFPWSTFRVIPNGRANGDELLIPINKGYVYTANDEVIASIKNEGDGYGVIKINASGKVLWQLDSGDCGLSLLKDKILSFNNVASKKKKEDETIYARLIDASNGKIIKQTEISKIRSWDRRLALVDANQNFQGFVSTATKDWFTTSLDLTLLDEELSKKSFHFDFDKKTIYLGIATNTKGAFFMAIYSYESEELIIKKLNRNGEVIQAMSYPIVCRKDYSGDIMLQSDVKDPERLIIGYKHQNKDKELAHLTAIMDFANKKTNAFFEILEKPFEKTLKAMVSSHDQSTLDHIENLRYEGFVETENKLITVRELKFIKDGRNGAFFILSAIIITTFDKELKNPTYIIVPKDMTQDYDLALSSGFHLKGNNLYVPYSLRKGLTTFNVAGVMIDITTGKQSALPFDNIQIPRSACIEPDATFWFKDFYLLHFKDAKGFKNNHRTTYLQKVDY